MVKFNNIEWLRLLFACQVMLVHTLHHVVDVEWWVLKYLPGVPAFFFLSGFLIYASYGKSQSNFDYFVNRFLRLFPALIFVCLISLLFVFLVKYGQSTVIDYGLYLRWFFAQITLGQAYNPSEFRDIGVGVINGSLWTITVELLFYISVPVIFYMERFFKYTVHLLCLLSFLLYSVGRSYFSFDFAQGKTLYDFLALTPLVWGWMFLFGVLAFKYFDYISIYISRFWVSYLVIVFIAWLGFDGYFLKSAGNELGVVYFLFYVMAVLHLAFGVRYFRLSFDLSYGVYIWHMVVINVLLVAGMKVPVVALLLTVLMAVVSWFFIEKPSLKLKKYSVRL